MNGCQVPLKDTDVPPRLFIADSTPTRPPHATEWYKYIALQTWLDSIIHALPLHGLNTLNQDLYKQDNHCRTPLDASHTRSISFHVSKNKRNIRKDVDFSPPPHPASDGVPWGSIQTHSFHRKDDWHQKCNIHTETEKFHSFYVLLLALQLFYDWV